ncbi:DUF6480 family protein [Streptomyces sp. IB2014 016-6]|uniref:DUF6480 family protein n=1 Tax=Streptomyces sp. IB2014 016-6 TaxID=2517818 RepID=UPI0011CC1E20|nr:DUF6480 family protein [Streptomyces sp. IB2014 016-6]TXL89659.1 hypothetical protein EW053_13740 [Streptomyces sp. IB2014 016-6]
MTDNGADPDPRVTTGLEAGGSVPPGETPPGESSTGSELGPRVKPEPGWAKGPLIAIATVTVLCAGFFVAYAVYLLT